jgi:hypothetical protein
MGMFEQDFLAEYTDEALVQEIQRVADLLPIGPLTKKEFDKLARVSSSTIRRRFGGWRQALAAAGLVERYSGISVTSKMQRQSGRGRSSKEILDEIRRVASSIEKNRLTIADFNHLSAFSVRAVRTAFGSWPRALALAGIHSGRDAQRGETKERYLGMLKTAAGRIDGHTPSLADFNNLNLGISAKTIARFFGNWSKALNAAGLDLRRTWKQPFTEQECLENLDMLWSALGRQPLYDEVGHPPSIIGPKAYERIWGTYSHALKAYEMWRGHSVDLNSHTVTLTADNSSLLEELRRVSRLAGTPTITQEHINQHSRINVRTFARRFGSWEAAVKEAGLQLSVHANRYDDDELFNNIMAVWEALGRTPKCRDMEKPPSHIPSTAYVTRFDTWRKGLMAFLKWVEIERSETPTIDSTLSDSGTVAMLAGEKHSEKTQGSQKQSPRLPLGQRDRLRVAGPKLRFRVMQRDKFRCCLCGRSQRDEVILHLDHVIPWSDGGRTILENLQTLCCLCNQGKGNSQVSLLTCPEVST